MGSIRDEIKQTRPFASRAEEGVVTLLRTADRVRAVLGAAVEPQGITLQQYNVLRILRGAGADGLPTLEIATRMIEASPGITRLLDRLEAKGLVRRWRCPADRRQVLCRASESAVELLASLDQPMLDAASRALAPLGARRTADLVRKLDLVRSDPPQAGKAPTRKPSSRTGTKKETRR